MKKQITILCFALLLSVFLMSNVFGAIAQVAPLAKTNQTANFQIIWTFVNVTDEITDPISANSSFQWNATGSWVTATKSSFMCNATGCNATLAVSSMTEGLGTIRFNAGNASTANVSTNSTLPFRVDYTNPTATLTVDRSMMKQRENNLITWSASDAGSGLKSTALTFTGVSPCPSFSSTASSGTVPLTGENLSCIGTYTVTILATDEAGLTTTSSPTITVQQGGGSLTLTEAQLDEIANTANSANPKYSSGQTIAIGLIIIGLIALVVIIFRRKF